MFRPSSNSREIYFFHFPHNGGLRDVTYGTKILVKSMICDDFDIGENAQKCGKSGSLLPTYFPSPRASLRYQGFYSKQEFSLAGKTCSFQRERMISDLLIQIESTQVLFIILSATLISTCDFQIKVAT
jgi:hypothetical protein